MCAGVGGWGGGSKCSCCILNWLGEAQMSVLVQSSLGGIFCTLSLLFHFFIFFFFFFFWCFRRKVVFLACVLDPG